MKTIKYLFLSFGLLFSGQALAQNLSIADAEVGVDANTATIVLNLENTTELASWQARFELPEGFSFKKKNVELSTDVYPVDDDEDLIHTVKVQSSENVYTLIVDASPVTKLSKNAGQIATINITVPDAFTGSADIRVFEIHLSDTKAVDTAVPDTSFKIKRATATAINGISLDDPNAEVYTVGGKRVKNVNLKKGVYVVNGKKVVVK